jgi:hypothetical protein
MDFHKILAENLLRFGAKNIDHKTLRRFLTEQTQDDLMKAVYDDPEFQQWDKENQGKVKLVKAFEYKNVEPVVNKVAVPFFNNFVTIDQGSPKPDEMKTKLDAVLESLKQAGANLDNPKTTINIISTATEAPAGINIDKDAKAAGRTKIDHDYNGKSAQLADLQKTDLQYGNKILAQKRGESAKAYIESKGVKAKITITTKIVPIPEGRYFQIVAKVQGQEKSVGPINAPAPKLTVTFRMDPFLQTGRQVGTVDPESNTTSKNIYETNKPSLKINYRITGKFGESYVLDLNNMNNSTVLYLGNNASDFIYNSARYWNFPNNNYTDNPFWASSKEQFSDWPAEFMSSIGYMTKGQARGLLAQMNSAISPMMLQLHGIDIISKLKSYYEWCMKMKYISMKGSPTADINYAAGDSIADKIKDFNNGAVQFKIPAQTVDISIEKMSSVVGGSPTISTDVKYWGDAIYIDKTTTPPTFGDIKKNPGFFAGATLVTK